MKPKWKMILLSSWALTIFALLCMFESCRVERYENEQYRMLRGEFLAQQGESQQVLLAILEELDGVPEQKRVRIFGLLKSLDEKIEDFQQEHDWYGGEEGITDLIKAGKITDPTIKPNAT